MSTSVNDIRFLNSKSSLRQFYENARNNIEDPIFTGFTMEIDKIHSPLFFSLAGDELETLRGGGDTGLAERIEKALEKVNHYQIESLPDTYEIATLPAKEPLDSSNKRKSGYGLWDKYYLDNVLYGAVDYIYMVDKITDGTYTDDFGVADIGGGTPSSSKYEYYGEVLNNVTTDALQNKVDETIAPIQNVDIFFNLDKYDIRDDQKDKVDTLLKVMEDNPNCKVQLTGYADKYPGTATPEHNMWLSDQRVNKIKDELINMGIDPSRISIEFFGDTVQPFEGAMNRAVTCQITEDLSQKSALDMKLKTELSRISSTKDDDGEEQNEYLNEHKQNEDELKSSEKSYNDATTDGSEYKVLSDELESLTSSIPDQKRKIEVEHKDFIQRMNNKLELLKVVKDGTRKTEIYQDINNIFRAFESFKYYFDNGKDSEPIVNKEYSKEYSNLKGKVSYNESEVNKELYNLKDVDEAEKEYYEKIWKVLKSRIEYDTKDSTNKKINELKEKKEVIEQKIYGVHDDGVPGTAQNPAPGSLAHNYQQAKDKFENDIYSITKQNVDTLKDIQNNYDDIQEFQRRQDEKKQIERFLPTMDNEKRDNVTRKTYEVPQTVYDMLGFVHGMNELTHNYPYALQSITGLDDAYKKYFELKDPYMGSGDGKITINCLEFLDMRVTSMFNKYFNSVYDRQYRRERVPINLRRFNCSIFVHDIRNFKNALNSDDSGDIALITKIALNCLSVVEFKFLDCEIVPEETGGIFDNVSNNTSGDMRSTNFTFTYGNCIINFLPFEDLKKYVIGKDVDKIEPGRTDDEFEKENFDEDTIKVNEASTINGRKTLSVRDLVDEYGNKLYKTEDSNFRRWFDKSEIGNVNNNDYREYIRHDSSVAVDDHFKTTIVNNFAMNSVVDKNRQLTEMDDALRRLVTGISASTGIPVKGVTDALNIQFIDPILNERDLAVPIVKEIGNVNNSKVVDEKTMEYVGTVIGDGENKDNKVVTELGNVNDTKKGGN